MRSRAILVVFVVAATTAFICSPAAHAQSSSNVPAWSGPSTQSAAQLEASRMVPARAVLTREIDARKMHSGEQFSAELTKTVYLKDGAALPKGTNLVGTIAKDAMTPDGKSTLVLRFTTADLKDGKAVPIVATIVGVAPPSYGSDWALSNGPAPPAAWDGNALTFDEIGAISGFDLHSSISGANSVSLVSTKKDEVKLADQTQLSLAIAGRETGARKGQA